MVLANPIPWGDIYANLYQWAYGATGLTTVWAKQDEPRPDYPYILLDVIAMPREGGTDEIRTSVDLTRARDIKITPIAQNATTYIVEINGTPFSFLSDNTATVAEITAGLKVAIDAGSEPVSTVNNGTDLDVIGDPETANPTVSQLFNVTVTDDFDGAQISWMNNDAGNEVAETAVGRREFTVNVQAFDRNTRVDNRGSDPDRNPFNQLSILQSSLGLPSVQAHLANDNIAVVEELPIQDLSDPVEDAIESRASMDIRMRTISQLTEYIGYIDTATLKGTFTTAGGQTITESFQAGS
jgi:hypothetical protein